MIPPIPHASTFAGKRQQVTEMAQVLLGCEEAGSQQDKNACQVVQEHKDRVRRGQTQGRTGLVWSQSAELVDSSIFLWLWGSYHLCLSGHWFPTLLSAMLSATLAMVSLSKRSLCCGLLQPGSGPRDRPHCYLTAPRGPGLRFPLWLPVCLRRTGLSFRGCGL